MPHFCLVKPAFAIIGCGRIAHRHAEQIARLGTLSAVCDIVADAMAPFVSGYGARPYSSLDDLLAAEPAVEVVCICTPNGLHAAQAIQCLRAGKHVLCEKPMAIKTSDAMAMMREADSAGKKLFVVKQNRFNPPVMAVKRLLDEGKLGRIFSFQVNGFWHRSDEYYMGTWRGTAELDGGSLFTQFSHFIDLIYWFLGDLKEVRAARGNFMHPSISIEDTGVAILEMANGAIGTLHYTVNSFGKNMEGSLTLFGEKGTIKIGGQYLNTMEYQQVDGQEPLNLPDSAGPNTYGFYEGSMSNHDKLYEALIHSLSGNNNGLLPGAAEAYKTVEIINRIYAYSAVS